MEERKAYFDLVLCKEVGLTDDEVLKQGGFTRFVSLGKWDLFSALRVSAANLYIEKRVGGEIN